ARIEEFHRYGRKFAIALVDLDHFKRINDEHSHEVGDQVLERVAKSFTDPCRGSDSAARVGGEGFLLRFPEADAPTVARVCEELRRAVQSVDWSDIAPGIIVSLSAGVAEVEHGSDRSDLLNAADRRLYQAKRAGRNLVRDGS